MDHSPDRDDEMSYEEEEKLLKWNMSIKISNMWKLITHEDYFHLHKILGVVVLTHYIFRFLSLLFKGTMGFEEESRMKLLVLLAVHLLLSVSSFIFRLPPRRNKVKPMIWPELRLHNVVFAARSILDIFCHVAGFGTVPIARAMIAFVAMLAADLVTEHYRKLALISKQESTMRSMPWPADTSRSFQHKMNVYYGMSQLFATAGVINISRSWKTDIELAFTTLFAIQLSALLMTLVRKSIITAPAWHFYYALSLLLTWVLALVRYTQVSSFESVFIRTVIGSFVMYFLRFQLNVNKYMLWTVFFVLDANFFQKPYKDYPFDSPLFPFPNELQDLKLF